MLQIPINHLGIALSPLQTAIEAQNADKCTIEELGIPGIVLMEHAGRAVVDLCEELSGPGPVLVLAGPGNNGGDGWVAARHLWGRGIPAMVLSLRHPQDLKGDAALASKLFRTASTTLGWSLSLADAPWRVLDDAEVLRMWIQKLSPSLIIDAFFGTGLGRPLAGTAARTVDHLKDTDIPIVAVDLPSGLPTDGQTPVGPCVNANKTITFSGIKIAHVSEPGSFYCGDVHDVDIGILRDVDIRGQTSAFLVEEPTGPLFSNAHQQAHKGHFGHVGVLMGHPSMAGASHLAAYAALRAGAGKVSLICNAKHDMIRSPHPEIMHRRVSSDDASPLIGISALVVGPGLGSQPENQDHALNMLLEASQNGIPTVLDADGLQLLSKLPRGLHVLATPHPGEAARLLGIENSSIQHDRFKSARALANLRDPGRTTFVLKGACPIITGVDQLLYVLSGGHQSLAVGGSGDVLAGLLGALLARRMTHHDAAIMGNLAHQRGGAWLESQLHARGHLASELADALPHVMYASKRGQ
jgi:ADP-dependent NAD(P)H-hydrate dehydratase / NAD(P)H-hydrate epimerase